MTKAETIVTLLPHWPDWQSSGSSDMPGNDRDSRLLLHDPILDCPPGIYSPLAELDRCLTLMSKLGKQQAVPYERRGGAHDGAWKSCSLANARWHVIAYYCPERHRIVSKRQRTKKGGWVSVSVSEPVRSLDAREDRARAGVEWIAREFRWGYAYRGLAWLVKNHVVPGLVVPDTGIKVAA